MAQTLKPTEVPDPPFARLLFNNTYTALGWLVLRLYLGYQWITASQHKLSDPGWMQTGEALKKFWVGAAAIPAAPAKAAITFDWYRSFLQFLLDTQAYVWFAKVIAVSELLIGIALVLGLFTGIAAFGGALMNWNFMMAGSASSNPLLFTIAIGLMLAWKVAGYYGVDRYLLPALGTPWQRGPLIAPRAPATPTTPSRPVIGTA